MNSFIHHGARIGNNVEIGPFCYISDNVEIGDGCIIAPHVTVYDYVKLGRGCKVFPGAVLGAVPQDLKFDGEISYVEIGDNTTIRECVTVNRGTGASGKYLTRVGGNCLLMSYVHIAHDCKVGDNCILSSYTGLAGETDVDDFAIFGGGSLVHQFSHIGSHVMIGGASGVVKDVPPYVLASRNPIMYEGINVVGLRRRGFTSDVIEQIKDIYQVIFYDKLIVSEACQKIREEFPQSECRDNILNFISNSKRGILRAAR